MTKLLEKSEIQALPIQDRLQLIEDLWDSIDATPGSLPLQDWQRDEIDRRLVKLDNGESVGSPWDEVRRRIAGKP